MSCTEAYEVRGTDLKQDSEVPLSTEIEEKAIAIFDRVEAQIRDLNDSSTSIRAFDSEIQADAAWKKGLSDGILSLGFEWSDFGITREHLSTNGKLEYLKRPGDSKLRAFRDQLASAVQKVSARQQVSRRLTFDYKEHDAVPAEMKEILSQFDLTNSGRVTGMTMYLLVACVFASTIGAIELTKLCEMKTALACAVSLVALPLAGLRLLDRYPTLAILLGLLETAVRHPGRVAVKMSYGATTAPVPGGLAELSTVEINGAAHRVLVRGRLGAPLLLVLHGGPGTSQLPFAAEYQRTWEAHFRVVQYDQRGTGASARENLARPGFADTLTVDQHVEDCIAFTEHLLRRFPSDDGRVFLLGGSWGSRLAVLVAERRPDLFRGPVVLYGLVTDPEASERLGFAFLTQTLKRAGVQLDRVEAMAPPVSDVKEFLRSREWLSAAGGMDFASYERALQGHPLRRWQLKYKTARQIFAAREVSFADAKATLPGLQASLGRMRDEPGFLDWTPPARFPLPVVVAQGRTDHCTAAELVEPFLQNWSAPSKRLSWFARSGHTPHKEEPEAFGLLLRHVLLDEAVDLVYPVRTVE